MKNLATQDTGELLGASSIAEASVNGTSLTSVASGNDSALLQPLIRAAEVHRNRFELDDAEAFLSQAVEVIRTNPQCRKIDKFAVKRLLARVCMDRNNPEPAKTLLAELLTEEKDAFGELNPALIRTLRLAHTLYTSIGDETVAKRFLEWVDKITAHEELHPQEEQIGRQLEICEAAMAEGLFVDAEKRLHKACDLLSASGAKQHKTFLGALEMLASAKAELGKLDEAISTLGLVARTTRDSAGKDHPDTAIGGAKLALMHLRAGDTKEARRGLAESLRILEVAGKEAEQHIPFVLDGLVSVGVAEGEREQIVDLLSRALRIRRKALPEDHPDIRDTKKRLSALAPRTFDAMLAYYGGYSGWATQLWKEVTLVLRQWLKPVASKVDPH